MAYTLGNKYAKNLCKRTVLHQLIIKNVVTYFILEHSVDIMLPDDCTVWALPLCSWSSGRRMGGRHCVMLICCSQMCEHWSMLVKVTSTGHQPCSDHPYSRCLPLPPRPSCHRRVVWSSGGQQLFNCDRMRTTFVINVIIVVVGDIRKQKETHVCLNRDCFL